jgi:hypothetical protein
MSGVLLWHAFVVAAPCLVVGMLMMIDFVNPEPIVHSLWWWQW